LENNFSVQSDYSQSLQLPFQQTTGTSILQFTKIAAESSLMAA